MLPFRKKFEALNVGESFCLEKEDYVGQVSRAAYNIGLSYRKIFSTRRIDGFIWVVRLM